MSYTSRKPYLGLKDSIVELYKKPIRFLHESVQKESQFEKPYGDDTEYPTMHFNIPAPDWPVIKWNPIEDFIIGDPGIGHPIGDCGHCSLVAHPILNCETEAVEVHPLIYCTNTPMASGALSKQTTKKIDPEYPAGDPRHIAYGSQVEGSRAGDTILRVWVSPGKIKELTAGMWSHLGPSVAVWLDPTVEQHTVLAEMIDGEGNRCYAEVDVTCGCECPGTPSLAWDDANTDDTLDSGGFANLAVVGGCPPFDWTITYGDTGAGKFSLAAAQTQARTNILNHGGGACTDDDDARVNIQVVDSCGTSAGIRRIRMTGGHWYYPSTSFRGFATGTGWSYCFSGTDRCREIYPAPSTNYAHGRWKFTSFSASNEDCSNIPNLTWALGGSCVDPSIANGGCGTPVQCADWGASCTCPDPGGFSGYTFYTRVEWHYWSCSGSPAVGCS